MAYACPVCEAVEADGEHLASHLAITAIRDPDHEAWLETHAPDWGDDDPSSLAARVTDRAESIDHELDGADGTSPPSFESAVAEASDHGRASDPETRAALDEARRLTERMREDGATDDGTTEG
jgi:hypothetical protein